LILLNKAFSKLTKIVGLQVVERVFLSKPDGLERLKKLRKSPFLRRLCYELIADVKNSYNQIDNRA